LTGHNLKTAKAYQIRLTLQELFTQPTRANGEAFLKRWYFWPPILGCSLSLRLPRPSKDTGMASYSTV